MCTLVRIAAGAILLALPARPQSGSSVRQFPISGERETYGLTVSVTRPELFTSGAIDVEVRDASGVYAQLWFHITPVAVVASPLAATLSRCRPSGAQMMSRLSSQDWQD